MKYEIIMDMARSLKLSEVKDKLKLYHAFIQDELEGISILSHYCDSLKVFEKEPVRCWTIRFICELAPDGMKVLEDCYLTKDIDIYHYEVRISGNQTVTKTKSEQKKPPIDVFDLIYGINNNTTVDI